MFSRQNSGFGGKMHAMNILAGNGSSGKCAR